MKSIPYFLIGLILCSCSKPAIEIGDLSNSTVGAFAAAEMVKYLDAATRENSDISRMMGAMARMFSSRRERTVSVVGLEGAASVNSDMTNLRIAGKLGAKFFVFDAIDGNWIDNDGLTKDGKKAIREINEQKMLILTQNLSEKAVIHNRCEFRNATSSILLRP